MNASNNRPTPWSVLRGAGAGNCLTIAGIYLAAALIGFAACIELGLIR